MKASERLLQARWRPKGLAVIIATCALFLAASPWVHSVETSRTFATADEAVAALTKAVAAQDMVALQTLFGPGLSAITSPDPVQAANDFKSFAAALSGSRRLVQASDDQSILEVGAEYHPFPVPLVKRGGRWFFDTDAGKEEVINRRVGQNELAALKSVRVYVEAQREYASRDRTGDDVLEYAQKLISSPGKRDGLYWEPELDGEISPIGPLVAFAQNEVYMKGQAGTNAVPEPFHGYYFKILTRQGANAPGGKYNYIINGHMIGGFALLAWPAAYGDSGIMSFVVNQRGRVYQKDLGPKTAKLAKSITEYNPDKTWMVSPD